MTAVPQLLLESKGIVLAPSTLVRSKGSLRDAINVNIDAPGVIRSRQGFARQSNGFGGPTWKMASTKELGSNLLINYGTGSAATALKYGDGSVAPTAITGTVNNTADARMRCAVARRNHYLTASNGLRRLETTMALFFAGQPKGLGLDLTGPANVLVGAPGTMLADGSAVAFRSTICRYDAENNLMEGAPSSRSVVYNRTGTTGWAGGVTKNVTVRALLPKENCTTNTALTTAYFIRIYRSLDVAAGEPPDDMRLVYEAFLTAGDITNGYVEFVDATPNSFRQLAPALHTNANDFGDDGVGGPGVAQANEPPPIATDVALFQGCLWLGDLTYRHGLEFTLLSVVAATGLSVGDVLTFAGTAYTAVAGAPANNQFNISAAAAVSEAIARTAQNLVEAINKSTTNTAIYAFYVSQPNGLPGRIRLEARDFATTFTAVASAHGAAGYRPSLAAANSSTRKNYGGGLAFSKPYLPDAFPAVNFLPVGRDDTHVLALHVLGETLFVFTDDGLYRLIGTSFLDWDLRRCNIGGDFVLIGRELVVECDGALYAMGRAGIARITESSLDYVSVPIEPLLLSIFSATTLDWMKANGWAVAYRSQHKVIFSVPINGSDRNCGWMLVYDTRMQAWTRWLISNADRTAGRCAGVVRFSDDLLFMGIWNSGGTDAWIFKEKRTYAAADYSDVDDAGVTGAFTKTLAWNVLTADPTDVQTFDELHLFLERSTDIFAAWTTPTALSLVFASDLVANAPATLGPKALTRTSRAHVPQSVRSGTRLLVTLTHAVAEFFGLEGAAITVQTSGSTRTSTQ